MSAPQWEQPLKPIAAVYEDSTESIYVLFLH